MLSENPQDLLSISNRPPRSSVYEKIFAYLQSHDVPSLHNDPDALLDIIEKYSPSKVSSSKRKAQFDKIIERFNQTRPACILDFGVEEDCGYSLIYLAGEFSKLKPDVSIYTAYDLNKITHDELRMLNYLVDLSGITQIKTFYAITTLESFLSDLNVQHKFEWVLLNHESDLRDVENLKMLESLSLIRPGLYLMRINDYSTDPGFESYLLSPPMIKRIYSSKLNSGKYSGRWNLIYDEDGTEEPILYKCEEFLDS